MFNSNRATYSRNIYLDTNSSFVYCENYNTKFLKNIALVGRALYVGTNSTISCQKCAIEIIANEAINCNGGPI